jgi:threonine synthase
MTEKIASAPEKISGSAMQRCIATSCGGTYGLAERIYVCPRCRGPLEIEVRLGTATEAANLRNLWKSRAVSDHPQDRSGVWRFRELLPFSEGAPIVTLFEGNTPLYDAPRCAEYAGLESLQLKHQGCNPTGSFKDSGMTVAVTQAVLLGARTDHRRQARAEHGLRRADLRDRRQLR